MFPKKCEDSSPDTSSKTPFDRDHLKVVSEEENSSCRPPLPSRPPPSSPGLIFNAEDEVDSTEQKESFADGTEENEHRLEDDNNTNKANISAGFDFNKINKTGDSSTFDHLEYEKRLARSETDVYRSYNLSTYRGNSEDILGRVDSLHVTQKQVCSKVY